MHIGMVSLGRMGGNMARRLMRSGHSVVAYDHYRRAVDAVAGEGAAGAASLADLRAQLASPAAIWSMLPAGEPSHAAIAELRASALPAISFRAIGAACRTRSEKSCSRRCA